jgi:hypothetical protein
MVWQGTCDLVVEPVRAPHVAAAEMWDPTEFSNAKKHNAGGDAVRRNEFSAAGAAVAQWGSIHEPGLAERLADDAAGERSGV